MNSLAVGPCRRRPRAAFDRSLADYFSFIKRLMELLRTFARIRKIELEIQTVNGGSVDADHPRKYRSPRSSSLVDGSFSAEPLISRAMLYDNAYLSESSISQCP